MADIAHIRSTDGAVQPLRAHLWSVAALCGHFSAAANLNICGLLIGLLHDLGKYSTTFQNYIREDQGEAEMLEDKSQRVINHSAAGAQLLFALWEAMPKKKRMSAPISLDLLASAILSHHNPAGLVDFLSADGEQEPFAKRLARDQAFTFLPEVRDRIALNPKQLLRALREIAAVEKAIDEACANNDVLRIFHRTLLMKYLYSCLIDADRTDSSDFENPGNRKIRSMRASVDWNALHARFENTYQRKFGDSSVNPIHQIRRAISNACLARADSPPGLYRLPVPTGGGKTLASLRFALAHAAHRQHGSAPVRHIIYVLPFTTILVQNAKEAREFIGEEKVLEHHANLLPDQITRRQLLLSENWDAPVIFTTTVQFLNAFYSDSKEAQRRMHQAASAVLIFDEAQALPIKTLHLFNNALNFLVRHTATTALICTATQPLLDRIDATYGRLGFSSDEDLCKGIDFDALSRRTRLIDKRKTDGSTWSHVELCQALQSQLAAGKHTLVIVNTKEQAQKLFDESKSRFKDDGIDVAHLSNNLCPAHLRDTLANFHLDVRRKKKESRTLLCISTSLVEAGVDLDFDLVVRDVAGFVSLIQAAGRCNRHGYRDISDFWVINLEMKHPRPGLTEETNATDRVLRDMACKMDNRNSLLLNAENVSCSVQLYFEYYYHEKKEQMLYPVKHPAQTTIIDLLTRNEAAFEERQRIHDGKIAKETRFCAAPESAANLFEVIDSSTHGVIVPYTEKGKQSIVNICSAFRSSDGAIADSKKLLAKARPFVVNLYDRDWKALCQANALHEVQKEAGVYYLDERHYHVEKGVTIEESSPLTTCMG